MLKNLYEIARKKINTKRKSHTTYYDEKVRDPQKRKFFSDIAT